MKNKNTQSIKNIANGLSARGALAKVISARAQNPDIVRALEKAKRAKSEKKDKNIAAESEFDVKKTKIKIIGIGGGGGNIVSEIAQRVKKASFAVANTDYQALKNVPDNVVAFQFGEKFTHGLGTGMDAMLAEEAAKDEKERIKKLLEGQDLVILVSALGGGTGSGATPVFAQISKSLGNLTYGIFTMPFVFEGAKKNELARASLEKARHYLNAITILPNERVFQIVPKTTAFTKTLSYINRMLYESLEGLVETIYDPGLINIDFADLRAILSGQGKMAFLNTVTFEKGGGSNIESFEKTLTSPLYPYTIEKARGLLLNIVGGRDLKLSEVNQILTNVGSRISREAKIIFGISQEPDAPGGVRVTVLATGCAGSEAGDGPVKPGPEKEPAAVKEAQSNRQTQKKAAKSKIKRSNARNAEPATSHAARKTPKKGIKVRAEHVNVKVGTNTGPAYHAKLASDASAASAPAGETQAVLAGTQPAVEAPPVRKNAIQVKKEIEAEERAMLEKEKAWDIPAFLRKKPKTS